MTAKSEPSVRSSDLEAAGRAASRLVAAREASPKKAGVVVPAPVRWARLPERPRHAGWPASVEPPVAPEPDIDLAAIEAAGDRGWNAWLAWACAAAPADAAFVVDHHGLEVASYGDVPDEDREVAATRLVMALEQASLLESPERDEAATPTVSIDWRGRTWTASREAGVVLCLVSLDPIPRARLARVASAIGRAAAGLAG